MPEGFEGLKEILNVLNTTKDKTVKKCAKAGINAGLTPLARAMRMAINSTSASTAVKRAARKTIGKSLKKKVGTYVGKAGFAVGRRSKKSGVGISASNIHWFVLGTEDRYQKKSGKYTGKIKDMLKGVVPQASIASRSAMLETARKKITQILARETVKARR